MSYDEHTVPHVLSDKAFPGAARAHQITSCLLFSLLNSKVHNIDFNLTVNDENFATKFHEPLMKNRNCQN